MYRKIIENLISKKGDNKENKEGPNDIIIDETINKFTNTLEALVLLYQKFWLNFTERTIGIFFCNERRW
jgi:hypothetical protein